VNSWSDYYRDRLSYEKHLDTGYIRRLLANVVHFAAGGRVLEVGIGTGYLSIFLSKQGLAVTGIDVDEEVVSQARFANRVLGGSARFLVGDAFRLRQQFEQESFDVVFHQGLLEHFSDKEIRAMLDQQLDLATHVLFSVPSSFYPRIDYGNERLMKLDDWMRLLEPLGCPIVSAEYHGHAPMGCEHVFAALRGRRGPCKARARETTGAEASSTGGPARVGSLSVSADTTERGRAFTTCLPCHWVSYVLHPSGYASMARNTLTGLGNLGHPVSLTRLEQKIELNFDARTVHSVLHMEERSVQPGSVMVFHHPPADFRGKDLCSEWRFTFPRMSRYVCSSMFETDSIPTPWVQSLNSIDEVWVPTRFNEETYSRAGVDPHRIHRIPFGIDPRVYTAAGVSTVRFPGNHGFNFLSVFEWTKRKGWDILLRAYVEEFKRGEDVALNLIVYRGSGTSRKGTAREQAADYIRRQFGLELEEVAPINIIEQLFPYHQMPSLYRAADAFILPSRGEGWGMPYMEAMAMGTPTIGTRWSGNLEFMNPQNSFLIEIDGLEPVDQEQIADNPYYRGHKWASPSVEHTRDLMRYVFEHRDEASKVGRRGREEVLQRWTIEKAARAVVRRLAEIEETAQFAIIGQSEAPSTALPRPQVLWCAPFFDPSGYGSEARGLALTLAGHDIDLAFKAVGRYSPIFRDQLDTRTRRVLDGALSRKAPEGCIAVVHFPAYAFQKVRGASYTIGRTMFETDNLPADWVARCNAMDEIWVPTDFNLETFRKAGVATRLVKVPGGVDTERFRPGLEPLPIAGARGKLFLSVFEWGYRKGWDVLLRAWAQAFGADEDVTLVLRTYPVNATDLADAPGEIERRIDSYLETLDKSRDQVAPIVVLGEQVPDQDMPRLYAAADALVAPSRGEGWGRPQMEAMACGVPVVATRWGGNLEFMNEANSLLIDIEGLVPVDERAENPAYRGHHWAEPSARHLAELMRWILDHPEESKALGKKARQDVAERWGWHHATKVAADQLREIWHQMESRAISKPASPLTIRWEGDQFAHHSLAHVNREMCISLAALGHQLSIVPTGLKQFGAEVDPRFAELEQRFDLRLPRPAQIHVRHGWPPDFRPPVEGHWVMVQPWEFGSVPKEWIEKLREQVDDVWVPTSFVRDCYVRSGLPADRVHVVPNGVRTDRFRPGVTPMALPTDKRFKFLFVGGTIYRKGPDILLEAYRNAFTARDDVCLVIKDMGGDSFYKGQTMGDLIRQLQSDPNAPRILHITEDLPPDSLPALYAACDCLVQPYRGEGFGLPIAEAMASGLPVIVTGAGASLDFCDDSVAYLIPAQRVSFPRRRIDQWETVDLPFWYEPDCQATARLMRQVFEEREEARVLGARASARIRQRLGWEVAADRAVERMKDLIQRPIVRFQRQLPPIRAVLNLSTSIKPEFPVSIPGSSSRPISIVATDTYGTRSAAIAAHQLNALPGLTLELTQMPAARALNQVLNGAGDEPVLLLSGDLVLPEGSVDRMLTTFVADPRCAVVGPVSNRAPRPQRIHTPYKGVGKEFYRFAERRARDYLGQRAEVSFLGGFCLAFNPRICRQVGSLREDVEFPLALWDFFSRVRQSSYKLAVALDSFVHHDRLTPEEGSGFEDLAELEAEVDKAMTRAQTALRADKTEEAVAIFAQLVLRFPDLAAAHAALGATLMATGRVSEALSATKKAAELAPDSWAILNQLGVVLCRTGDLAGAASAFGRAAELDPKGVQSLLNLVELHRSQRRYHQATERAREALQRDPSNIDVLVAIADLSLELGDPEGAEMALARIDALGLKHPDLENLRREAAERHAPMNNALPDNPREDLVGAAARANGGGER